MEDRKPKYYTGTCMFSGKLGTLQVKTTTTKAEKSPVYVVIRNAT